MANVGPAAAAVVVYNVACGDSITCRNLAEMNRPGLQVLIYDNSTRDFGNEAYCRERGWVYLGGSGNAGISKAYNACVDYLKTRGVEGLLCLFDDDTAVSEEYFTALEQAAAQAEEKIFVPLIRSGGRLMSPCRLTAEHRVRIFGSEQEALEYRGSDLSAINSCMAIDLRVFDDFRYDENIFLDGVDHHFTRQMHTRGIGIRVIGYGCDHAFSGDSKPPVNSALNRFRIYAKDYGYILRDNKPAYWKLVGKRAVSLCLKYRSLAFLREL